MLIYRSWVPFRAYLQPCHELWHATADTLLMLSSESSSPHTLGELTGCVWMGYGSDMGVLCIPKSEAVTCWGLRALVKLLFLQCSGKKEKEKGGFGRGEGKR